MKASGDPSEKDLLDLALKQLGQVTQHVFLEALETVLTLSMGHMKSAASSLEEEQGAGVLREGKKARATGLLYHPQTGPDLKDKNNNKMNK